MLNWNYKIMGNYKIMLTYTISMMCMHKIKKNKIYPCVGLCYEFSKNFSFC